MRGYKFIAGQALPEYVVGCLMIATALFAPIPALEGRSASELLVDAFQASYRGYEFAMSQPSGE